MNKLEFPGNDERLNPTRLYLARGAKEISPFRPYLIGDVFDHVPIPNGKGGEKIQTSSHSAASMLHAEGWRQPKGFDTGGKGLTP